MSDLFIPTGYQSQTISVTSTGSGGGYISEKALNDWARDHPEIVGTGFDYRILEDKTIMMAVQTKLSDNHIDQLRKKTNPKFYDKRSYFEH